MENWRIGEIGSWRHGERTIDREREGEIKRERERERGRQAGGRDHSPLFKTKNTQPRRVGTNQFKVNNPVPGQEKAPK